jgi:exopolysaccharide biosynthesis polyprenyl glycosylphosphotransferase
MGQPMPRPLLLAFAGAALLFPMVQTRPSSAMAAPLEPLPEALSPGAIASSAEKRAPKARAWRSRHRGLPPPAHSARVPIAFPVAANDPLPQDTAMRGPVSPAGNGAKRLLDIVLAGSAIVLLAPVFLLLALWIRLDSSGPVIFRQHRRGLNGKPFEILKFRSMRVLENGSDVRQVRRHDDRVTRSGRVIRATSLDELPQLFNVLKGEMSLVGPRPHAMAHDDHYGQLIEGYSLRQSVKPGLSGWAQVNGYRGETPQLDLMVSRVCCDLWYIRNRSFWLDLRILFRTVGELFHNRNVY